MERKFRSSATSSIQATKPATPLPHAEFTLDMARQAFAKVNDPQSAVSRWNIHPERLAANIQRDAKPLTPKKNITIPHYETRQGQYPMPWKKKRA